MIKKPYSILVNPVLFICLLASSFHSQAQIVIHQADMPDVNTNAVMAVDSITVLSPQNASPNVQTWNYSSLKNTQTNAYIFVNPANTSYYSAFQSSNLADTLVYGNGYTFYSSTPSSFSSTGFGEVFYGYKVGICFKPYFEQLSLPATYGSIDGGKSRGDTTMSGSYSGFDSARVIASITYSDTIDAWGVMTTPYGTDSVIRQKHKDITVDSILAHDKLLKIWVTYTVITTKNYQYRWYAKGVNYFFATMQMNSTNTKDSVVQWYDGANLGIDPISKTGSQLTVYPNPCSNEITFSLANSNQLMANCSLTIYDITGRQVTKLSIENSRFAVVNTSYLSNGLYIYCETDQQGNVLERGKFAVQR